MLRRAVCPRSAEMDRDPLCLQVGRLHGAGTPLLRTIMQAYLKLFKPKVYEAKRRLLFVLRDRTKTPLDKLQSVLMDDLQKVWASLAKPHGYEESQVTQFFEVDFVALPSFESSEQEFKQEAHVLRQQFEMFATAAGEEGKLPGSALSLHMAKLWEVISADKDLSLPAQRILVATVRCEEISQVS